MPALSADAKTTPASRELSQTRMQLTAEKGGDGRGRLIARLDLTFGPSRSFAKVAYHMVSQGERLALPSASLLGMDKALKAGAPQHILLPSTYSWAGRSSSQKAPKHLSVGRDPSSLAVSVTPPRWGCLGTAQGSRAAKSVTEVAREA